MATFLLVHGSFHGAWCWEKLVPLLQAAGHRVVAPDLPGSGADTSPLSEATLDRYVAAICAVVDEQFEPPILVAHSMGSIVCAQVAERRPKSLAAVVYVCGLLLRSGETLMSFLGEFAHLGVRDLVIENMVTREGGAVSDFPASAAPAVFYNRCSPADAQWAAQQLRPQANAVYGSAPALTAEGFGRVRRFYVFGLDDLAVPITFQRLMVERTPCERTFELDTDHSPFLSAPDQLAGVLVTIAAGVTPGQALTL
jgi:pimeloyl-ACP methyl ester carboxylesterase